MNSGYILKLILLAAAFLLLPAGTAFAADITVGASCTLAQAITAANTNTATGDCAAGDAGADTITLTGNVNLDANLPLVAESITINGEGYVISGADTHRCFDVVQADIPPAGLSLTLNKVIIADCKTAAGGGAIRFWNQQDVTDDQGRSSLTLNDVVLRGSLASGRGGGILTGANNLDHPVHVEINRSAIHDNRSNQNGGGIYFAEGTTATVNNSTVYMNTADNRGGGIHGQAATPAGARFTLNHVTVTGNTASLSTSPVRAGGVRFTGGTLMIRNSIIAGNMNAGTVEDCQLETAAAMITVTVTTSIIGSGATANCRTINAAGMPVAVTAAGAITDPGLKASPTVSGGIPPYYELVETSPAINAVPDCSSITMEDQRGEPRPFPAGGPCDIGAFEFTLPVEMLLGPIIYVPRDCALPVAITAANTNKAVGRCWVGEAGADTIVLTANVELDANLPDITESLTINGNGYEIDGQTMYSCFDVQQPDIPEDGLSLSLNSLILDRCRHRAAGGAIRFWNMDVDDAQGRSELTLNDVVLRRAHGNGNGGAIFTQAEKFERPLYVEINRSAIHNNRSDLGGGGLYFGLGTQATINNSSIYGNTAATGAGGIYGRGEDPDLAGFTLNHVTVTGNTAGSTGGVRFDTGTLTLRNSIIAGNTNNGTDEQCRFASDTQDLVLTEVTGNIIGATASANCTTINADGEDVAVTADGAITDPGLASSPTVLDGVPPYYDLMADSPAIDAAGDCAEITTEDQRSQARPYPADGDCDIGALEYVPASAFGAVLYVPRDCALRHAISAANTNMNAGRCRVGEDGADTIILTDDVDLVANLPIITESLTINGNGYIISGETMYRCFDIVEEVPPAGLSLSLNDVIIEECYHANLGGGAIRFWIQTDTDATQGRSSLTLNDVVLRNSRAWGDGGAIFTRKELFTHPVYVEINRSAIYGNRSVTTNGGGLYFALGTQATINNSSIYGNRAERNGGGIYGRGEDPELASFTLNHVTVTANTAATTGGVRFDSGTLTLRNSIIAGNSNNGANENCRFASDPQDLVLTEVTGNIIGATASANCTTIDAAGEDVAVTADGAITDPMLAASPTVSGLRAYYDLMAGSPAINAAGNCREITRVDQRGYLRPWPVGGRCDIGAIEYGSQLRPPPTPTPTPAFAPTPTPTPRPCPSPPEGGNYGAIGSGQWQGHYARLGIQAQANQAAWAQGDAGVRGANTCFWDYDCSTDAHWAYGSYHATRGHVILAPGSPPPLAVGRSGGKYNLCYSVWANGCNSTEAWEFGFASGKQIYDAWFYQREIAARSEC